MTEKLFLQLLSMDIHSTENAMDKRKVSSDPFVSGMVHGAEIAIAGIKQLIEEYKAERDDLK